MTEVELVPDSDDLRWTLTRTIKDGLLEREEKFDFDLSALTKGYSVQFLLALKVALIRRRQRVSLQSIATEHDALRSLLLKHQESGGMAGMVEQIDLPFLASLETIKSHLNQSGLGVLKRFFNANRSDETIFAAGLLPEEFPRWSSEVGQSGAAIKRILSQALSRATMSHILTSIEDAYETNQIDIGHYSFAMLAFQVFFRPASYRQLRLMDLIRDEDKTSGLVTWFVDMLPVKTRMDNPNRLSIRVTSDVGDLLKLQQVHVVQTYGHLVAESDLGKLALFPARKLKADGTWQSNYANQNHGICADSTAFTRAYLRPIEKVAHRTLSFNALRHTVGTQLALAGLSASSIAAVLRHATDDTCQRYVDLFFQGVLDRISDAMQPSFDEHFPVYRDLENRAVSKQDPIAREKAIFSEDPETGRREVTAECGRASLCGYAPLACYECNKFRPCWDADHTINLRVVDREIADFDRQGLAMQHEVRKYKHIRNGIRIVINICELKKKNEKQESNA